jgi:predicted Zn finger-like uncharacterized protein
LVVTCEKCSTRFRLDESRIPPTGARVRCSRCKHAFFLAPAGEAGRDGAIQSLADQALAGEPNTPPVTQDLADTSRADAPAVAEAAEPETLDDDENRWEFSEALPNDAEEEPPPAGPAAEAEAAVPSPPWDAPLAGPAGLDLVGEAEGLDAAPGEPLELEPQPAEAASPAPLVAIGRMDSPPAVIRAAPGPAERAAALPPRRGRVAAAVAAVGWLVVAALVGVGLEAVLLPQRAPAVAHALRAGGVTVHGLRGRFVENALGPLFVVSAELHNPASQPQAPGALRVVLLARDGASLPGASAWLAPALDERTVREGAPEDIELEVEHGARRLAATELPPDARVRVDAVLVHVPAQAVRLALEEVSIADLAGEPPPAAAPTEPASPPSPPSSPE